jgi:hypothetical protein
MKYLLLTLLTIGSVTAFAGNETYKTSCSKTKWGASAEKSEQAFQQLIKVNADLAYSVVVSTTAFMETSHDAAQLPSEIIFCVTSKK